jgi:hypothetical protein
MNNPRVKRVLEGLWQGGVARVSDVNPGMVEIEGVTVCRISLMSDLLRTGVIEVCGARSWRSKTCQLCGGVKTPDFPCCENLYA